ncbi:MAG TPA: TonB-dependent receptor, partial [Gammaproteobacteria bacterium]
AQRRNSPSFPITTTPVVCGNGALNGFNLDGTAYTCVGGANPVPAHPNNPFGADALFVGRVQGSGGDSLISYHDSRTTRLAAGLSGDSFNAFDEDWGWNVDLTRSRNEFILTAEDTLAEEFQLALLGLGGENCSGLAADAGDADAGCFYFNPFGTSLIPGSGGRANPAEVYDYITGTIRIDTQAELRTLSAVATSNPFVMEGGNSGLAVGVQLRNESLDYDYDENSNRENFIFFTGNPDFDGERDIKAAFTELALPVKDNMDVQLSLRYEDYEDSGNSTDPKIAVLYRPADNLSLRSSFSTSFRAPSLFQQSGVQTTLVEISTDTLGNQFIPVRSEPNPDDPLKPEEANVINLGASWISSSAAFKLNADYWSYDYENVIIQQNPQGIVNQAQEDGNPCNDPQITCSAGTISRVLVYYDNASELQTDGLDLSGGYSWAIDSGNYAVGLELTKILSYDLKDPQAGSIDGLGQRNFTNFANSVPELRANLHLAWSLDRHAVNAFSRFIDSYNNDQLYDGQPRNETIDAQTTLDIQYSYRFQAFGWADDDMTISVGGINITDEDPPHVATNGGYDSKVHDPRGALYYLKLNMPL